MAENRRASWHWAIPMALTLAACGAPAADQAPPALSLQPQVTPQVSGTDAAFIAVDPVNGDTAWASGGRGTWARTVDGGATWRSGRVPGADSIQFRDVHAVSGSTAYLLSIGNGPDSRIYKTTDGGANWQLQFTNQDPNAFFDCFDFWDENSGLAFSDSHEGRFTIITTTDGTTWNPLPVEQLPPANSGEGAFASSGTCLVAHGDSTAWIGTGASDGGARVLRTDNRGRTWTVAETPIIKGGSAGIATLSFRDANNGIAMGGDIANADSMTDNVAVTSDGGRTWTLAGRPAFTGAVYGSAWVPGAPTPTVVAVGPRGISYSTDNGATFVPLDTLNHWSVAFASPSAGWAVGPGGRISKLAIWR